MRQHDRKVAASHDTSDQLQRYQHVHACTISLIGYANAQEIPYWKKMTKSKLPQLSAIEKLQGYRSDSLAILFPSEDFLWWQKLSAYFDNIGKLTLIINTCRDQFFWRTQKYRRLYLIDTYTNDLVMTMQLNKNTHCIADYSVWITFQFLLTKICFHRLLLIKPFWMWKTWVKLFPF